MATCPPLIVTLKLDQATFEPVNSLRQQYFPPERNFLPAHVTLFHQLPGKQEDAIQQTLRSLCSQTSTFSLHLNSLHFLGRGVAVEVDSPELTQLHQQLVTTWGEWLTAQDQQPYRPHITIQNKVTSEQAQQVYEHLQTMWKPFKGLGEGLLLWRYLNGPWESVNEFAFTL